MMSEQPDDKFTKAKNFYDKTYYRYISYTRKVSRFHRNLANRLGIQANDRVLDVACGTGDWLLAVQERQASVSGIDISTRAIEVCRSAMPDGRFEAGPAEHLPFQDESFDWITCLGSLEHFLDKEVALTEMHRVGKPTARYVILVPNAGFLTRRLGVFSGTEQVAIQEDVLKLEQWYKLFVKSGFAVVDRWADLHVLSLEWIMRGKPLLWPLRLAQALSLLVWPLGWQYQVFHLCHKT